jgi:murein DD-endopeptidase MepM/ murein hydrolase activator NlpD
LDARPDLVPTKGKVTSKFGYRTSPFTGRRQFHQGIDIANDKGTPIYAAGTGIVTFSGWNAGYGKTVIISHGNGYRSVYAHNNEYLVEAGQKVKKGDLIAKMGSTGKSTGPHLHFEIHSNGKQINPENVLIR